MSPSATTYRRVMRAAALTLLGLALTAGALWLAYRVWLASGPRAELRRELAPGIIYRRVARSQPRTIVAHVLSVDLQTPGLHMVVTPPDAEHRCMPARTTSEFLQAHDLTVSVNAGFFFPFRAGTPWDYYPKRGDCVNVLGRWQAQGIAYGVRWKGSSISFTPNLQPQLGAGSEQTPWTITGASVLVRDGHPQRPARDGLDPIPYPRNALCLHKDGRTLHSILIDGRQPGYSEGLTLNELAEFAAEQGCAYAIELDGGGSVTMVARGGDGAPSVLNRPIHTRIPGRERPVANHLGFWIGSENPSASIQR